MHEAASILPAHHRGASHHDAAPSPLVGRCVQVRWSRVVNCFDDPDGVCGTAANTRHVVVSFVVCVTFHNEAQAIIEAWLELPGGHRVIVEPNAAACIMIQRDGLNHVDVVPQGPVNGEFLLRLTLRAEDESLLFASTPLLAKAGFRGGSYDRPTVHMSICDCPFRDGA